MRTRLLCAVMLLLILLIASPYEVSAEEIKVDAKGAVLMDAGSGTILLEQNAHEKCILPASQRL